MARQVLENGVVLPAEYSDDWYDDMTSNLTKLDDVIGSDSEKLSSADVGAAALSNNYNDLDNKPTIPTVNDATLTIQKNGVDVQTFTANASSNVTCNITVPTKTSDLTNDSDFVVSSSLATVATSGSYTDLDDKPTINDSTITIQKNGSTVDSFTTNGSAKTINIPVPTKTSDLTNDSNFVDTSNPAVSSGITSAKVTDYDTHIADTDIHVTTADKATWNAVTSKANDSDVVHKSGDETVGGIKTFTNDVTVNNSNATVQADVPNLIFQNPLMERASTTLDGEQTILFTDKNDNNIASIQAKTYTSGTADIILTSYSETSDQSVRTTGIVIRRTPTTSKFHGFSDNITSLGDTNRRWKSVYAMNYYYGNDNVEFSTKFVTTDTNQTISGNKTFSDSLTIYNSDDTVTPKGLAIRNAQWGMGESGGTTASNIDFLDKNYSKPASITASKGLSGQSYLRFSVRTKDSQNTTYAEEIYYDIDTSGNVEFRSWHDNTISLGTSAYKWKDVQTYKVNGLEPSSLSLPSGNASDFIDISSYFSNTGSGEENSYTASANGWIYLRLGDISGCQAGVYDANNNRMWGQSSTGNIEQITIPILKGQTLSTQWNTGSTVNVAIARFIPCQGNV